MLDNFLGTLLMFIPFLYFCDLLSTKLLITTKQTQHVKKKMHRVFQNFKLTCTIKRCKLCEKNIFKYMHIAYVMCI